MNWTSYWRRSLDQNFERSLSAFGDHLLRHRLAAQRRAPFFVYWVRRFASRSTPPAGSTAEGFVRRFLENLEQEGLKDWQVEQARQAVTAWLAWRDREAVAPAIAPQIQIDRAADGSVDPAEALAALEQVLRVRHYAFRTERPHLDWVRRFFDLKLPPFSTAVVGRARGARRGAVDSDGPPPRCGRDLTQRAGAVRPYLARRQCQMRPGSSAGVFPV